MTMSIKSPELAIAAAEMRLCDPIDPVGSVPILPSLWQDPAHPSDESEDTEDISKEEAEALHGSQDRNRRW